ncbi:dipeptidase PepV [Tenuibacillus multivorans]|uniref:Succinyl-diaminopimelate desuccinylase n=1 Tax=Tenuibacillus multivorans TaxID=237069 RepID=A0A1G9WDH4_9BACI|nr:dipeptidase PepV [Tenuibacillus multivorans]GEL76415.1 dipeptidase PepV [Tenuibacillus multivorans]SDM82592.1 succinyl-diaminopimelate desuccinylase [Tenuibacillus multivorans]
MPQDINFSQEVNKRKDELINDLSNLLSIKSVKDLDSATDKRPMGNKIGEALDWMLNLAEKDGFQIDQLDGYVGWVDLGEGEEEIVTLGHLDVVPAPGQWSHNEPFEPLVKDGKLYARGAIDDKGPTMAAYYAMKVLKELDLPLKRRIRLILGTDEESGMRCMKKYVETFGSPKYGFSPDADFPIIYAEKGQINAKIAMDITESNEKDVLHLTYLQSGERGNMVPDHVTAHIRGPKEKLEAMKKDFKTYCEKESLLGDTQYKSDNELELSLNGKTVHGMEPFNGINAALKLVPFLTPYEWDNQSSNYLHFIQDMLCDDFYGNNMGIAVNHDEVGPLTVNAGAFRYELGDQAEVHLNIRCPVGTDYDQSLENIQKASETYQMELRGVRTKDPHYVDRDHPTIKIMQNAYETETNEEPTLLTTGGATYARFLKNGVAYGASFPGKTMTAHQVDEHIEVDDLLKATAIYARALYDLANEPF